MLRPKSLQSCESLCDGIDWHIFQKLQEDSIKPAIKHQHMFVSVSEMQVMKASVHIYCKLMS